MVKRLVIYLAGVSVLSLDSVSGFSATPASSQSCGDIGGNYCSQTGSCPAGFDSLGTTFDCNPCCQEAAPAPSCGDMGGDYCSQTGSCPSGFTSLGTSSDCSPCCKEVDQGPSCGQMGGDYCSQTGSCPSGFDFLAWTFDCNPCCQQAPPSPSCGEMGGDHCSQTGSCPAGFTSLGASFDCNPCCLALPPSPSCGEMGGNYCSQTGACPAGFESLGSSSDCSPCCVGAAPTLSCGEMGGDHCSQTGVCPAGFDSLGNSNDCSPCCLEGVGASDLTCGQKGGTYCSQDGTCLDGLESLGTTSDCKPCCGEAPPPVSEEVYLCADGSGERVTLDPSGIRDATEDLRTCMGRTREGSTLRLQPGTYRVTEQLRIEKPITLCTADSPDESGGCLDSPCDLSDPGSNCARLLADRALAATSGFLVAQNTSDVRIDHIVLDGNRGERVYDAPGRLSSTASRCKEGDTRAGMNASFLGCQSCQFLGSASIGAVCGSALQWVGRDAIIVESAFLDNGQNSQQSSDNYLWADGLTLLDSEGARVEANVFRDNTDVALIVGNAPGASILGNRIVQERETAFAGLMLDNFDGSQCGDFRGAIVRNNTVRCDSSPRRLCFFGIQLGPHPWYLPSTLAPRCGSPAPEGANLKGGTVNGNSVEGAAQGIDVDGAGSPSFPLRIYDNSTSGAAASFNFPACGARPTSSHNATPSPDSEVDRRRADGSLDPTTYTDQLFHVCVGLYGASTSLAPLAVAGGPYSGTVGEPVAFDGTSSRDPDGTLLTYRWDFGDGYLGSGVAPEHRYTDDAVYTVNLEVMDSAGIAGTASTTVDIAPTRPPQVELSSTGTCGSGCSVTFVADASDPEGEPLSYAWSGCASGSGPEATCGGASSGDLVATVTVGDSSGGTTSATATATIYAASFETGGFGPCVATEPFTCTSSGPSGCTRQGTESLLVRETSWTLDSASASSPPTSSRPCTESAPGFVAGYSVGPWGACSKSCGGGTRRRSVSPNLWTAIPPDASRPAESQACNTKPCALTCYDYPDTFPRRVECHAAGFSVCERRFRSDGLGGTLTCYKGF